MITRMSHVSIWVQDQDAAKDFYINTLGMELRGDEDMDGFRWLTVGPPKQPELELALLEPGPPMMPAETAAALKDMLRRGAIGAGAFDTDDCRATHEQLVGRGVEFLQEPTERPYGIEATFRDNSGNWFSLTEPSQND